MGSFSDGSALAREFEATRLKQQVTALDNVDDLRQVAIKLIDLNFQIKRQVAEWVKIGWLQSEA